MNLAKLALRMNKMLLVWNKLKVRRRRPNAGPLHV
jgi:hypothetical protein